LGDGADRLRDALGEVLQDAGEGFSIRLGSRAELAPSGHRPQAIMMSGSRSRAFSTSWKKSI
jgi:hypothetical protein